MEKKFELKFGNMNNEITNLKKVINGQNVKIDKLNKENYYLSNEIGNLKDTIANLNDEIVNLKEVDNIQNGTIEAQDNIIQTLREENDYLSEMGNQYREWIMALQNSYNQLDADYNDLNNSVEGLNYSLQGIINNLNNLHNFNPFNINFFE